MLTATNGEEAIQLFQTHQDRIALVVLDVVMPRMTGPQAYERIRSAATRAVPMIFYDRIQWRSGSPGQCPWGREEILQKSYNLEALAAKIRETLDRKRA